MTFINPAPREVHCETSSSANMPKKPGSPNLPVEVRYLIVWMSQNGIPPKLISKEIDCNINTVYFTSWKFNKTGGYADEPRAGRPQKLTDRDICHLKIIVDQDCWLPLTELTHTINNSWDSHVSALQDDLNFYSHMAAKKPFLKHSEGFTLRHRFTWSLPGVWVESRWNL